MKTKKLVIFGLGAEAELAYYYFTNDSVYEVSAFTVDREYCCREKFFDLPVVAFDDIQKKYPAGEYDMFVAIGYSGMNKNRMEKYYAAKEMGYTCASYISSHATILNDYKIGDNCFILEDNTIQPFVTIGNNVTLWSGNHIGHHSSIADHCFITSHVVICGFVKIMERCFLGVNSTIRDEVTVAPRNLIGAGALILKNTDEAAIHSVKGTPAAAVTTDRFDTI